MNSDVQELFNNIDKLHTTELGYHRIKNNLDLKTDDIIQWSKTFITNKKCVITKKGKNWYACIADVTITINKNSFTIITAHKK